MVELFGEDDYSLTNNTRLYPRPSPCLLFIWIYFYNFVPVLHEPFIWFLGTLGNTRALDSFSGFIVGVIYRIIVVLMVSSALAYMPHRPFQVLEDLNLNIVTVNIPMYVVAVPT